jgi:pimeloyl-ACP methyl ester carboxylesterase
MIDILVTVLLVLVVFHLLRTYVTNKSRDRIFSGTFDGEIFTVQETMIAIARAKETADKTIICFPGFTEDARYFAQIYKDSPHEVIYMGNAGYHSPYSLDGATALNWATNPHPVGTIEHDGFWVALAIENLTTSKNIVIHGHSRGGAVALEVGKQKPELMKKDGRSVHIILEAAVVPQGLPAGGRHGAVSAILIGYLLPFIFAFNRNITVEKLEKFPMMKPGNPQKAELLRGTFSTVKKYQTNVINAKNIAQWQDDNTYDVYDNFASVTALVGERDDVLDCATMIASVQQRPAVNFVQTKDTNHFITQEQPHYVHTAIG